MVSQERSEHDRHAMLGENHWFSCGYCDDEAEPSDEAFEPPRLLDFDIDASRLTIGDIEVIEDALRTLLLTEPAADGIAPISEGYKSAVIATLAKVERMAKPKVVG